MCNEKKKSITLLKALLNERYNCPFFTPWFFLRHALLKRVLIYGAYNFDFSKIT